MPYQGTPLITTNPLASTTEILYTTIWGVRESDIYNNLQTIPTPIGYTGHIHNTHTNLSYAHARYLNSKIGVWLSSDPYSLTDYNSNNYLSNPAYHNTYSYALNNPVMYVDPDGKAPQLDPTSPSYFRDDVTGQTVNMSPIAVGLTFWGSGSEAVQLSVREVSSLFTKIIGSAKTETKVLSKAEQIKFNARKGKEFADEKYKEFSKLQDISATEVTIKTNETGVRFRVDAIGKKSDCTNCYIQEYKSSPNAPLTINQKIGFAELAKSGGTVMGKGKLGFPSGLQVANSTIINIVRP